MPVIIGTKNQPKSPSPSLRWSMTNAGAEAMNSHKAAKLKALAPASRWNRGLAKMET